MRTPSSCLGIEGTVRVVSPHLARFVKGIDRATITDRNLHELRLRHRQLLLLCLDNPHRVTLIRNLAGPPDQVAVRAVGVDKVFELSVHGHSLASWIEPITLLRFLLGGFLGFLLSGSREPPPKILDGLRQTPLKTRFDAANFMAQSRNKRLVGLLQALDCGRICRNLSFHVNEKKADAAEKRKCREYGGDSTPPRPLDSCSTRDCGRPLDLDAFFQSRAARGTFKRLSVCVQLRTGSIGFARTTDSKTVSSPLLGSLFSRRFSAFSRSAFLIQRAASTTDVNDANC